MHWKRKAAFANILDKLPLGLGYFLYRTYQKKCGAFRLGNNPFGRLAILASFLDEMEKFNFFLQNKQIVEIGPGWSLIIPVGCWLNGADKVTSVDLHPYLMPHVFIDDMSKMQRNPEKLISLFGKFAEHKIFKERLKIFCDWDLSSMSICDLLARMGIEYRAPADACALDIDDGSQDLHISITVLEHLSTAVLEGVFKECVRVLKPGGWAVHEWDMSDHFSHSDKSITPINFLQYSEQKWEKYVANKFLYVNRLRVNYYDDLFCRVGLNVKSRIMLSDERALAALQSDMNLALPFAQYKDDVNATTRGTFFAQK